MGGFDDLLPIVLFLSSFALVFLLGMQSLLVNHHHPTLAFVNSFLIGLAQLVAYKHIPDANLAVTVGFLLGGPFGIVTAMYVFRAFKGKK